MGTRLVSYSFNKNFKPLIHHVMAFLQKFRTAQYNLISVKLPESTVNQVATSNMLTYPLETRSPILEK